MFSGVDHLLLIARPDDDLDPALDVLRADAEVAVARTRTPAELDAALDGAPGTVVVAGGDGTMHAVVSALHDRGELGRRTVGLLPLGTGNDFARGVGIPLDPCEAASVVLAGRTRAMDVLVDERGGVVVNSVHAGAGSEAAKRGGWWKERLGKVGYPIGAILTALDPPALRLRVEVDGEVLHGPERRVLQVAVGNAPNVGGGTPLVPVADPGDGLLDVVVSTPRSRLAFVGYVRDLLRGRHHHRSDVACSSGRTVTVSGEEFWCTADGEIDGPVGRRTWRIEPAAYRMLVPAG